uniref:hypothetical protein n=1 Tax=Acetatifactor sp. TaxID=1872090 RepID=UPI004056CAC1
MIAKKYNLYYFKVDDFLDDFIARGVQKGYRICTKQSKLSFEQIFMKEPEVLCEEELGIYCEMLEFIKEDIQTIALKMQRMG